MRVHNKEGIKLMILRTSGKCLSKQRVCDGQVGTKSKSGTNHIMSPFSIDYFKADCEDKSDEQNCERMEQFYKDYRWLQMISFPVQCDEC